MAGEASSKTEINDKIISTETTLMETKKTTTVNLQTKLIVQVDGVGKVSQPNEDAMVPPALINAATATNSSDAEDKKENARPYESNFSDFKRALLPEN